MFSHSSLVEQIRNSSLFYNFYFYLGSFFVSLLKLFVKTDPKLILFISFGGRKFDDSPKAIYERMIKDERYKSFKIVWAFINPEQFDIPIGEKIKTDGLKYYLTALRARVWITNSSVERGLSFKGKDTFYFNTWHGTPIKHMGNDISKDSKSFGRKVKSRYDIMTAQGEFEAKIFSKVFDVPFKNFKIIGLPRNDMLHDYTIDFRDKLREKLGLQPDKKVILYAPTYREYHYTSEGVKLLLPIDLEKWERKLGDNYTLLFRAHYAVTQLMNISENNFVHDMSSYPVLEDLMIASDILVSDYSSILFDYSIMDKAMVCFTFDYDEYAEKRGVYFDIREQLPYAENEDDLLCLLSSLDEEKARKQTEMFRNKYVTAYGNASIQSLDIIAEELKIK